MFSRKSTKKKKLDAQVMPIEARIESLEKAAVANEESKLALAEAIEKELDKISKCAEGVSRK